MRTNAYIADQQKDSRKIIWSLEVEAALRMESILFQLAYPVINGKKISPYGRCLDE